MEFENAHITTNPPLLTGEGFISAASSSPIARVEAMLKMGMRNKSSGLSRVERSSSPRILLTTRQGMPALIMSFVISPLLLRLM